MGKSIDILFGVKGGSSINEGSGRDILRDLTKIASRISNDSSKRNILMLGLNKTHTQRQIETQLKDIIDSINKNKNFGSIDIPVTINGKSIGGSGGSRGGRGKGGLDATGMVNSISNYLTAKGSSLPNEMRAQYEALSKEIEKEGADLEALQAKRERLDAESVQAIKKKAEAERDYSAEMKRLAKEQQDAERQSTKTFEAEVKKRTEAQNKSEKEIESHNQKAKTMADAITRQMSGLYAQGKIEPGSEFEARYKKLRDDVMADGSNLKDLTKRWKDLNQELRNVGTADSAEVKRSQLLKTASNFVERYGEVLQKQDPDTLNKIIELTEKIAKPGANPTQIKEYTAELNNLIATAEKGLNPILEFFGTIGTRIKNLAISAALMALRKAIRDLYTNVVELDKAVVDLQVASGKSREEVKAMVKEYSHFAQELGTTTTMVAQGADTWLRQGYSAAEANELLADSTKLAVLGQMEAKEASTALTSAMKGYKKEVGDAIGIVDKFTAVDMEAAASAGDIATAMAETAASANNTGVSMDKLIGYLTVVKEVTQDGAESVGTFYKTLFARMGNIKAGKYVSDDGEDLNDAEKVLRKNGIMLRDSTNEFRNFGDVLDEVASRWETLDEVSQHAIATAFAGTRQQEKFYVLMQNYGNALKYEAIAAESAGTANKKYTDAYLNSVQARKNALTAAYESLSQTILNSETIKLFYEIVTKFINLVDGFLNNQIGRVATQFTLIFTLLYKGLPFIINSFKSIKTIGSSIITSIRNIGVETDAATTKTQALSSAWQGVIGIIGLAVAAISAIYSEYKRIDQETSDANKSFIESWDARKKDVQELQNLYAQYKQLNPKLEKYKTVEDQIVALLGDKAKALDGLTKGTDKYREAVENLVASEIESSRISAAEAAGRAKDEFSRSNFSRYGLFNLGRRNQWNDRNNEISLSSGSFNFREFFQENGFELADTYGDSVVYELSGATTSAFSDLQERIYAYLKYVQAYNALLKHGETLSNEDLIKFEQSGVYKNIKEAVTEGSNAFDTMIEKYVESLAYGETFENEAEQVALYKKIQTQVYKNLGISTGSKGNKTNPILNDAIKTAFNNLFGIVEDLDVSNDGKGTEYIQTLLDTLKSEDLEKATEAVSNLSKAIEEMEGNGKISLDTAKKLAEYGEEYVNAIKVENGELKVNSQALATLAARKLYDARATAIQNNATEDTIALYDKLIADVETLGSSQSFDRLSSLVDYMNTVLDFAGGNETLQISNLDRVRQAALRDIQMYRAAGKSSDSEEIMSLYKSYIDYTEKMVALQKQMYENDNDAFKESIESENDALEEQKKLLDKIYDARKKALDAAKDEYNYQKELASKNKSVADLQTQLAAARLDTSASGRARVRSLESELQQAQEDLDEFNLEHAIDIVSAKLDEEKEANDALYEKQKADNDARLDSYVEKNKKMLEDYEQKLKYEYDIINKALGDLTNEDGVVNKLLNILDVVKDIESGVGKTKVKIVFPSSGNGKRSFDEDLENEDLHFKIFHSGGIVDDLKLKDNETFAKLMKGEYVATPAQMSRFIGQTLPNIAKGGANQQFNAPLISIQVESVDKQSLPKLESIVKMAANKVKSELTSAFDKTGYRNNNKKILSYVL